MGVHDPCSPGQCMRTLQPTEQLRVFQLQLQTWLQTPPLTSSRWEMAGEIAGEIGDLAAGERCSVAASGPTW
jgi:hypothetical protein